MIKTYPSYSQFQFLNGDGPSFEEDSKFVFVLMPFGKTDDERKQFGAIYSAIQRIVETATFHEKMLRCSRADLEDGLIIMDSVCNRIKKAGLTIFEISNPNPNVYFELGLACALDKKVLLLFNPDLYYNSHQDEKLPFDINQFRYVEYRTLNELEPLLKRRIEALIKLGDTPNVDLNKIFEKVQKISRHLGLDSEAEQTIEDNDITDFELEKASDVLDGYWNDPNWNDESYKQIQYLDVEFKIRTAIGADHWSKVKQILRAIYWRGQYQSLIAVLDRLPAELWDVRDDFRKRMSPDGD